jgi:hypothetical protein
VLMKEPLTIPVRLLSMDLIPKCVLTGPRRVRQTPVNLRPGSDYSSPQVQRLGHKQLTRDGAANDSTSSNVSPVSAW